MRVLHCPVNVAGQPWEQVEALRALGVDATLLTFEQDPRGYPQDVCLHLSANASVTRRRLARLRAFRRATRGADIVHFHFGVTLLPGALDLPLLRALRRPMVMSYWGTDVRMRSVALPNDPYLELVPEYAADEATVTAALRRTARWIHTATVPDRELAAYVEPYHRRTVVVRHAVETEALRPAVPDPAAPTPLIVHGPSNKRIKGTEHVERAVAALRSRYRFEFRLLYGVSNTEVRRTLREADIVVDQLIVGTYGVLATEAMALGKPVVCFLREDVAQTFPQGMPIVNASPATVERELERLLSEPSLRAEIGRRGRAYAVANHDRAVVGRTLLDLYRSLDPGGRPRFA